jgi:L-lactate dehydrogenase
MGRVGSAIAFAATMEPIVSELVLLNRSLEKAVGDAMDLTHASVLRNSNMSIHAGAIEDAAGSDVIIFTPSVSPTRVDWKRSDLAIGNRVILEEWLPALAQSCPNAVLIMVTNPVDVMTYAAIQITGFPPQRVIGTGTLVDSIRYRSLLSAELQIHADDIRAYILGEHGDDQFAAYSVAMTGGEKFFPSETTRRLFRETVNLGYEVYNRKGYTNYGIALATMTIVDSIVYDLRHTMPVSVLVDGFLGVSDVCLSLPAVIGRAGVTRILHPPLSDDEADAFRHCAMKVRETIELMGPFA